MRDISRRQFIKKSSAGVLLPLISFPITEIKQKNYNRIVIRASWDNTSLSEISSLPVLYKQILRYIPQTEVILWPGEINDNLRNMLEQNFSKVNIVQGRIMDNGEPENDELRETLESSDLLLYFPGNQTVIKWESHSELPGETASLRYCIQQQKAFVIYGLGKIPDKKEQRVQMEEIAGKSPLVFVTDPVSEEKIKDLKLEIDNLEYSPDPLMAFDFGLETSARNFLVAKNLTERRYISIVLDPARISSVQQTEHTDKIRYLIEKWIQSTDYDALLISDKSDTLDTLNEFHASLTADSKARVKIYDGDFSAPLIGSLLLMSRIITGSSIDLTNLAINTNVPTLFLADKGSFAVSQSFVEIGMKDYVLQLEDISNKALYEKIAEINKDYLSSLIDFEKISDSAIKRLERSFKDISKIVEKTTPSKKSKKAKKR